MGDSDNLVVPVPYSTSSNPPSYSREHPIPSLEPYEQFPLILTKPSLPFQDKLFELWAILYDKEVQQLFKQRCLDNPQTEEEKRLGQALEVIINPF